MHGQRLGSPGLPGESYSEERALSVARWRDGERVAREERFNGGIAAEELVRKMHDPGLLFVTRETREPHLPIEPVVVGRNDARTAAGVAWLAGKFVLVPVGAVGGRLG